MADTSFLLKAEAIDKSFPGVHALDEVDFDLKPGEVHVLLGENGAGKSTLMKIFSGTLTKDNGRILIQDQEVDIENPHHARNLGIGMVYQELSSVPSLSVAENIFLGRLPKRSTGTVHWSRLFKEAKNLFDDFGVHVDPQQRVRALGMAERQLVEIAKRSQLTFKYCSWMNRHQLYPKRSGKDSSILYAISRRRESELFMCLIVLTKFRISANGLPCSEMVRTSALCP